MFTCVVRGLYQRSHLDGLAGLLLLLYFYETMSRSSFYGTITGILLSVAALEAYSSHLGAAEIEQSAAIETET
jgi:hypothetical protein